MSTIHSTGSNLIQPITQPVRTKKSTRTLDLFVSSPFSPIIKPWCQAQPSRAGKLRDYQRQHVIHEILLMIWSWPNTILMTVTVQWLQIALKYQVNLTEY